MKPLRNNQYFVVSKMSILRASECREISNRRDEKTLRRNFVAKRHLTLPLFGRLHFRFSNGGRRFDSRVTILTLPTINLTTERDFSGIFLGFLRFELLILTLISTLPTKNTSFYAVFPLLGRLKTSF